jgi:hypothetical protein
VSREWRNVDRWPDSEAKSLAYSVFRAIDRLVPAEIGAVTDGDAPEGVPYLRFSEPAQDAFDTWRAELEPRLRGDAEHPAIASHLSKYRSLIPSLALLIHLAEADDYGAVGLPALEKAFQWSRYLESHARRIFAASVGDDIQGARSLADKIADGSLQDGFALREVYRHHWTGLATKEDAEEAILLLIDFDWLRERREKTAGAPKIRYEINPKCRKPVA